MWLKYSLACGDLPWGKDLADMSENAYKKHLYSFLDSTPLPHQHTHSVPSGCFRWIYYLIYISKWDIAPWFLPIEISIIWGT